MIIHRGRSRAEAAGLLTGMARLEIAAPNSVWAWALWAAMEVCGDPVWG